MSRDMFLACLGTTLAAALVFVVALWAYAIWDHEPPAPVAPLEPAARLIVTGEEQQAFKDLPPGDYRLIIIYGESGYYQLDRTGPLPVWTKMGKKEE